MCREIERELDRLEMVVGQIKQVEAERDALRKQLARAPKASVELNALRAEVQRLRVPRGPRRTSGNS